MGGTALGSGGLGDTALDPRKLRWAEGQTDLRVLPNNPDAFILNIHKLCTIPEVHKQKSPPTQHFHHQSLRQTGKAETLPSVHFTAL